MARYRSKRTRRRSASQSAASLLALALPAPIQRVADTRLGPLLMLVGVPSMLVAGLLQINWNNGLPSVSVDPQAATKAIAGVEQRFNNFEQQGGLQDFGNAATDFLHGITNTTQAYIPPASSGPYYPTSQPPASTRVPTASFPSTRPQSATAQKDYRYTATQPTNNYSQQTANPQQPTYAQQNTQNPTYTGQSNYAQQPTSPSDSRNLTQQQLYQQYQQQLYEQQLRDQQYRQWLAQQQALAAQQNAPSSNPQQFDAYGRPVSTGYAQPANSNAFPNSQYGQQNYQGLSPNANPNGRY